MEDLNLKTYGDLCSSQFGGLQTVLFRQVMQPNRNRDNTLATKI
jgi:hypothetical protein